MINTFNARHPNQDLYFILDYMQSMTYMMQDAVWLRDVAY